MKDVDPTPPPRLSAARVLAVMSVGEQLLPHSSLGGDGPARLRMPPCSHDRLIGALATSSLSRPSHRTKATLAPSLKGWGTPGGFLQAPRHTSFLNCEVDIQVLALGTVARNRGGNLCFRKGQSVGNSQGTPALPRH